MTVDWVMASAVAVALALATLVSAWDSTIDVAEGTGETMATKVDVSRAAGGAKGTGTSNSSSGGGGSYGQDNVANVSTGAGGSGHGGGGSSQGGTRSHSPVWQRRKRRFEHHGRFRLAGQQCGIGHSGLVG